MKQKPTGHYLATAYAKPSELPAFVNTPLAYGRLNPDEQGRFSRSFIYNGSGLKVAEAVFGERTVRAVESEMRGIVRACNTHAAHETELSRLRTYQRDASERHAAMCIEIGCLKVANQKAEARIAALVEALEKFVQPESAPAALEALDIYPEPVCTDYLHDALVSARASLTLAKGGVE